MFRKLLRMVARFLLITEVDKLPLAGEPRVKADSEKPKGKKEEETT